LRVNKEYKTTNTKYWIETYPIPLQNPYGSKKREEEEKVGLKESKSLQIKHSKGMIRYKVTLGIARANSGKTVRISFGGNGEQDGKKGGRISEDASAVFRTIDYGNLMS